jgi:hypothetical protein
VGVVGAGVDVVKAWADLFQPGGFIYEKLLVFSMVKTKTTLKIKTKNGRVKIIPKTRTRTNKLTLTQRLDAPLRNARKRTNKVRRVRLRDGTRPRTDTQFFTAPSSYGFRTVNSTPNPSMRRARIPGRELLGDLPGATSFTTQYNFYWNPADTDLFKWVSQIARAYGQFHFTKLKVEYRSLSATSKSGEVIISTFPDVDSNGAADKKDAINEGYSTQCMSWVGAQHNVMASPGVNFIKDFFMVNPDGSMPATTSDAHMYWPCFTQVSVSGQNNTDVIGEIWVDYEIEFFQQRTASLIPFTDPTTDSLIAYSAAYANTTGISLTAPLGSSGTVLEDSSTKIKIGVDLMVPCWYVRVYSTGDAAAFVFEPAPTVKENYFGVFTLVYVLEGTGFASPRDAVPNGNFFGFEQHAPGVWIMNSTFDQVIYTKQIVNLPNFGTYKYNAPGFNLRTSVAGATTFTKAYFTILDNGWIPTVFLGGDKKKLAIANARSVVAGLVDRGIVRRFEEKESKIVCDEYEVVDRLR